MFYRGTIFQDRLGTLTACKIFHDHLLQVHLYQTYLTAVEKKNIEYQYIYIYKEKTLNSI